MSYFNAENETIKEDYDLLPPGDQKVVINGAEERQTKAGDGTYVAVNLAIVGGSYDGRYLFENHNIENPNEKAQSIGRSNFAKLCKAAGKPVINAPEDLVGCTLTVKVGQKKRRDTGELVNVIKKYYQPGEKVANAPVVRSTQSGSLDNLPF